MVPVFEGLITYLTTITEYSKHFKEYEQHGKMQSKNWLILPGRRFPEDLHIRVQQGMGMQEGKSATWGEEHHVGTKQRIQQKHENLETGKAGESLLKSEKVRDANTYKQVSRWGPEN